MISKLGVTLLLPLLLQGTVPLIDRTDISKATSLGIPAYSHSGSTAKLPMNNVLPLPSQVRDGSMTTSSSNMLLLELSLRNVGTAPFHVPLSLDQIKTHGRGSMNRIEMSISVAIEQNGRKLPDVERRAVIGLYSSDSSPESYYDLEPGQSMRIRVACDPRAVNAHDGDEGYIYVDEYQLAPDRYAIASYSNVIISQAIKITKAITP